MLCLLCTRDDNSVTSKAASLAVERRVVRRGDSGHTRLLDQGREITPREPSSPPLSSASLVHVMLADSSRTTSPLVDALSRCNAAALQSPVKAGRGRGSRMRVSRRRLRARRADRVVVVVVVVTLSSAPLADYSHHARADRTVQLHERLPPRGVALGRPSALPTAQTVRCMHRRGGAVS